MDAIETAAKRINDEARKFSPGIAEWIDARRAAGYSEDSTYTMMKAATDLIRANGTPLLPRKDRP